MQLADRDWLLYCRKCGEWTGLHRFLSKGGHFQGEHSITLNAFLNNDLLLGKFLIHHADHEVVPIPNTAEEYWQIRFNRDRFLESLIDAMVEERIQQDEDRQAAQESLRKEGYLSLLTLRGIFSERVRDLESQHPDEIGQAKVHLGKTLGIEWCREQIDFLLNFGKRDRC
jgi:hypothetical protein